MSHDGTNWAIEQRGVRPAAKIVLWHLCDRYHPDHGCFPSLDTLAEDCEMSRRSVQDQITELENAGLIFVEKMPRERGQMPRNRYRFPFENDLGQILPQANPAFGKLASSPWANSRNRLGQNLPTNPVRGTSKRTSKADETAKAVLSEVLSEGVAEDFVAHRRAIKKPMTEQAAKLIVGKLKGHTDPDAVANNSIMNGWQGVFPDRVRKSHADPPGAKKPHWKVMQERMEP